MYDEVGVRFPDCRCDVCLLNGHAIQECGVGKSIENSDEVAFFALCFMKILVGYNVTQRSRKEGFWSKE
jgi:hypothetical protein